MNWKLFFIQLAKVTLLTILILFGLSFVPAINAYSDFSIYSIIYFVLFSIVLFFLGKVTVSAKNVHLFTGLIMAMMFFKIIFSVAFIYLYTKMTSPQTSFYIFPFLIVYLIYTIFEVYYMSKVGQQKQSYERR